MDGHEPHRGDARHSPDGRCGRSGRQGTGEIRLRTFRITARGFATASWPNHHCIYPQEHIMKSQPTDCALPE